MPKRKEERTQAVAAKPLEHAAFPWERRDGEGAAAFTRFLAYRDMAATERSIAKVAEFAGISTQIVGRWCSRFQWVRRALAYDRWLLELQDGLGKHAVLQHRRKLARFASVSLTQATRTVAKLDPTKLTVTEATQLAKSATQAGDAAFGTQDAKPAVGPVNVGVGVTFNENRPSWIEQSETKASKTKVLVQMEEKVLAEDDGALPRTVETPSNLLLPAAKGSPMNIKERRVTAPKRKDDDD